MRIRVEDILSLYLEGTFPMAEGRDDPRLFVVDPERRGVIPLERFHLPRRLGRTIRSGAYQVTTDRAFREVVAACAAPGPGREETWINAEIERLYGELHARGQAHSIEVWREGALVGGVYGVAIGAAFFGESMFSRARDASKVALVHLVARLRFGGYLLLDVQFVTEHLAQFGAEEIARADYRRRLSLALQAHGAWDAFQADGCAVSVLQAISQTS